MEIFEPKQKKGKLNFLNRDKREKWNYWKQNILKKNENCTKMYERKT